MASEILGLFTTPQDYRAQQGQQTRNEALQYANLSPFQRAEVGLYTGGRQLGQATGSLFGMQDPQLKLISQRQALSQEIDPADPESIFRAAQKAAQMGDQQMALSLSDYARQAQVQLATAQQRLREGRAAATPKEVQIAQTRADLIDRKTQIEQLPDSPEKTRALALVENTLSGLQTAARQGQIPDAIEIAREQASLKGLTPGTPEYTTFVNDRIEKLTSKADKVTAYGADRNAIAQGEYEKDFADLTKEQKKAVNIIVDQEKQNVAAAGATKPPVLGTGKLGAKEITDFRSSALKPVEPYINTVNATDSALTNLKLSIEKNNPTAFRGARVQLAKAFGDATLNREDVREAGGDPSLAGKILDATSVLFEGTPTLATQRNIEATLKAMRKLAIKKGQEELDVQRRIATTAGFSQKDIADIFDIPAFRSKEKSAAGRTNETIPSSVATTITQVPAPAPAAKAPAAKAPAKGQTRTLTLKSGKKVILEVE
jgi:hypothetical protein